MITIKSKRPGFRRAGMAHPAEASYPDDFFTSDQLAQLVVEPMLELDVVLDDDGSGPGEGETGNKGQQETADPPEPTRSERIQDAISKLDRDNPDHFTGSGKPQTAALSDLIDDKVSAKERDAEWTIYQASVEADQ